MPITEAMKKAKQKYRENNKEKFRIYAHTATKKYQETHKEQILAKKKEYYDDNREAIKQRVLIHYYYKKYNDIDEEFKALRKMKIEEF